MNVYTFGMRGLNGGFMERARVVVDHKICDLLVPNLSLQEPASGLKRQRKSHKILLVCPKDFIALIEYNLAGGVAIAFKRTCQL
jgi:hypothetical protein